MLKTLAILALALTTTLSSRALAQHHDHSHAEVAQPKSFAACLAQIRTIHARIGKALSAKDYGPVHEDADALGQYAKHLGRLALKDTAVPRDQVKPVNIAGKDLAAAAEDLHNAAYAKNGDKSAAAFAKLEPLIARLSSGGAAPQIYVCDMHCEGCKTYPAPGTCTVCRMPFKKLEEVPFAVKVAASGSVEATKPATLGITLLDPSGCNVKDLKIVHEEPLHFMVVSNDLSFYAHEHPNRGPDGAFTLAGFTFPAPGKYTIFADFTPANSTNQIATTGLTIPGDPPASTLKLEENYDSILKPVGSDNADYEVRVRCNGEKFFAQQDSFLRIGIDLKGRPVADLEPWMGERGHLVIISADLKNYVHSHPITPGAKHDHGDHAHDHGGPSLDEKLEKINFANGKPSDITFHAVFPQPGLYRAFAQFKHNGKILTVPFTIDAQKLEGAPDSPVKKPSDHSGHNH